MENVKIKKTEVPFCDRVFSVLPEKYKEAYELLSTEEKLALTEIRLRAFMPCTFTVAGMNIPMRNGKTGELISCTLRELEEIVSEVCRGSVYSYSEHIKNGYVPFCGTRIGLSGTACTENGEIKSFTGFSSLSIRIPGFVADAADGMLKYVFDNGIENTLGTIAISAPNCGKTTFLRSFAAGLSRVFSTKREQALRVCIADERQEIYSEKLFKNCICDVISGVPKAKAVEMAMRTLSPQIIVCDEIGSDSEAEMLCSAYSGGIYLVVSMHGTDLCDLYRKKYMRKLVEAGAFKTAYILERKQEKILGSIQRLEYRTGCTQ